VRYTGNWGKRVFFIKNDDGVAVVLPLETPSGVVPGGRTTLARPDFGGPPSELAIPQHNSGILLQGGGRDEKRIRVSRGPEPRNNP
jgi:hypothetical protein